MCVCIFVIPQDLWRCPCPSESSGLTPLASLLCPAPPIMNGCMKAAVFVGTQWKITDFPTSHVQVCLIWWEPGGVGAACRSHSRDFSCCPDWCQPGDLAPPSASVSEFPALSWKWKKILVTHISCWLKRKGSPDHVFPGFVVPCAECGACQKRVGRVTKRRVVAVIKVLVRP